MRPFDSSDLNSSDLALGAGTGNGQEREGFQWAARLGFSVVRNSSFYFFYS